MRFMNHYDIEEAALRYDHRVVPNRRRLTATVAALADWTDSHSDGWAYWPKPARAAARAMALIDPVTWDDRQRMAREDATDAETVAALRPIKAFLTRHGVHHEEVIR